MQSLTKSVDLNLVGRQLHVLSTTGSSEASGGGVATFVFNQVVVPDNDNIVTKVALTQATIPVVAYNITSANCTLEFKINSTAYSTTITSGYYSSTSLVTAVNTALTNLAPSGGLTLSYSATTNRMTITGAGTGYNVTLTNTSGTAMWTFLQLTTNSAATSLTGTQGFNVQPTSNYWIAVSQFPNQTESSHNTFPQIVARIPVNQNYLSLLTFEPINLYWFEARSITFSNMTISIFDDYGEVVNMDNQPWSMCFHIEYAYQVTAPESPNDPVHTFISRNQPNFADPLLRRFDAERMLKRSRGIRAAL